MIRVRVKDASELQVTLARSAAAIRAKLRDAVLEGQRSLSEALRSLVDGGLVRSRSGRLRRSITSEPLLNDDGVISAAVSTNAIYARIQNQGGTISAENAAHLTIPLEAARTTNGESLFSARELIANPGIAGFSGTFLCDGELFGKKGRVLTPLFAIKTQVTLPGRFWVHAGMEQTTDAIEERLAAAVSAGLVE